MKKRAFCALLAMVLVLALLPVPAYAEEYVKIDWSNFPDPVFRDYVSQTFDADQDGWLSSREIENATEINIHDEDVTMLRGVEFLTSLAILNCNSCDLRTLDLSGNPLLEELSCSNNEITGLDLSRNPRLKELNCYGNDIRTLNVSQNTALTYLECSDNELTTLDISKNTALKTLLCYRNSLTKLDISKNKQLEYLCCYENNISRLDISNSTKLIKAYREGKKNEGSGIIEYWFDGGAYQFYELGVDADTRIVCVTRPKITAQPKPVSVKAGRTAAFKIKATGGSLKYQWYYQKKGSAKWVKMSGKTSATLKIKAKKALNGYRYRCLVKNTKGKVYSKAVRLTVK